MTMTLQTLEEYAALRQTDHQVDPGLGMNIENLRLASFVGWPVSVPIFAYKFAQAGFYYSGHKDEVICYSCNGRISDWEPGADPMIEHESRFPHCEFVQGTDVDNVKPNITPHIQQAAGMLNSLKDNGSKLTMAQLNQEFQRLSKQMESLDASNANVITNGSTLRTDTGAVARASASQPRTSRGRDIPFNFTGQQTDENDGMMPMDDDDRSNDNMNRPPGGSNQNQALSAMRMRMRVEQERLESFSGKWPTWATPKAPDLAKDGFFYVGPQDRVMCAFCSGVLRNWEPNDQAHTEHRKHFPNCPFVREENVGNVPLAPRTEQSTHGYHAQNSASSPTHQVAAQSKQPYQKMAPLQSPRGEDGLGVNVARAHHPNMAIEANRLTSYVKYPGRVRQAPELMARAGFFLTGQDDQVKCFFCDGGLRNWEPDDDPWTEHARWFSSCIYLRQNKDQAFIDDVQRRYPRTQFQPNLDPVEPVSRQPAAGVLEREMGEESVQTVLEMGFDKSLVRTAVAISINSGGTYHQSTDQLLEAVLAQLEGRRYVPPQAAIATAPPVTGTTEEPMSTEPPSSGYGSSSLNYNHTSVPEPQGAGLQGIPEQPQPTGGATGQAQPPEGTTAPVQPSAPPTTETAVGAKATGKGQKAKKKRQREIHLSPAEALSNLKDEESTQLLEEYQRLREERLCKVCMDAEANIVFLPCGHLVCCATCAPALRSCPICRCGIRGTVRTYMS